MTTEAEFATQIWDLCQKTPRWLSKEAIADIELILLQHAESFMRKALDDGIITRKEKQI